MDQVTEDEVRSWIENSDPPSLPKDVLTDEQLNDALASGERLAQGVFHSGMARNELFVAAGDALCYMADKLFDNIGDPELGPDISEDDLNDWGAYIGYSGVDDVSAVAQKPPANSEATTNDVIEMLLREIAFFAGRRLGQMINSVQNGDSPLVATT